MAQIVDDSLDISQDAPPVLTTSVPSAPELPGAFGFAPAPTVRASESVSEGRTALEIQTITSVPPTQAAHPRRRLRADWYESTVIALILSCAALCVYRLMWAIQP